MLDDGGSVRANQQDDKRVFAITEAGQVFGMAMYHDNHPGKHYDMANLVTVFEAPTAIAWEPGQYGADGALGRGGWVWRYDLRPIDESRTEVTLTYDWSAVPAKLREHIPFPPFPVEHLDRSLANLARLAVGTKGSQPLE